MSRVRRFFSRRWVRVLLVLCGLFALAVGVLAVEVWESLGMPPSGDDLKRLESSKQFDDGVFVNAMPMEPMRPVAATLKFITDKADNGAPEGLLDVPTLTRAAFATPPASGLRVTWLGHSTSIVELGGIRLLIDPVWSKYSGPSNWYGPGRFHAPPLPLSELPEIAAVVISHDHYDHLDTKTIKALSDSGHSFITPLGVGSHLRYWGVPADRITELDWWQEVTLSGVRLVCTPARHFSGRSLWDRNATLWAGWAMIAPDKRVFFSGDTGMHPAFREIGERLGPFDLTLIETGAYNVSWRDVHLGPEQAVRAHQLVGGKLMIPVHWGTFDLALHSWTEPAERVMVAAEKAGVALAIPQPGQPLEPSAPPPLKKWWPDMNWESASEAPVRSSALPDDL